MEKILTCPLGSKCIETKDNKIYECAWFVTLKGTNPQTGAVVDEQGCAMRWTPILLVENAKNVTQVQAATESFRNEMVKSSDETARTILSALTLVKPDTKLIG